MHNPSRRSAALKALLLVTWFETGLPGAQSNLEDVGSVYPRRIRFIVANAVSGGHALEFARPESPRSNPLSLRTPVRPRVRR